MLTFKKLIIVLTAIPLFLANFSALAADQNQMNIFLISDPHVDITKRQATHINPRPGTSEELDQKSFDTLIAKIGEQIDLQQETNHAVILLGDLPAHNAYSRKTTRDDTNLVFEQLNEKINPTPWYYVFGNNDSLQRDYGPFTYNGESISDLLKAITGNDDGFLSTGLKCPFNGEPCIDNESTKYGYYSAYLGDHLKLISLNSVVFVSRPGFSPSRDGATDELQWLEKELKTSQANHESVLLSMHVPPQSWETTYKDSFKNIIKAYPEIVIGMLAAHTHFDEIHAIKIASNGYVIPIVYSASIGSDHGNASSFKTLNLSRSNEQAPWKLKDYITYNFIGDTAAKSQLNQYYDFAQAFCSGNASSVGSCLNKHISNNKFDSATSTLMSKHYTAGNPNNNQKIDPSSKWLMLIK
ncbi:metallophosphoesterase [Legionella parisiensis]|uniref:3',5'-cyclic adenosine monophosphate phosphodiesterase CpdA n=1 Tax=Legionella parisiensis TaxID=45071 RepID=A0A1E5JN29_9GAMM|nr:metallophosphoesterase [Legionella parisiensis]KTD44341.1 Acid sphingomyelinase-like phosphodiesterase [Legionella parisiensis]OEH45902.1 3',5'-cyclic adenosine monophosphate phosphodiesterase CpdA [Legionella parisiensis]STX71967.1 Acid sphingomyelinase-like phosphodiesterase [Legionella parisiensis]